MKDKQLLAKSVILLYKESLIKAKGFNSIERIAKIIEEVSKRLSPEVGVLHNTDNLVISNLLSRIREMLELGSEHDYNKEEFLNDLELDCDEDKILFKLIKTSIEKDSSVEETKKSIVNIKRSLDSHYRETEVESILSKASYTFKHMRNNIPNIGEFLTKLVTDLETLNSTNSGLDPAITSEVDISSTDKVEEVLNLAIDKNSDTGIIKSGWQALNTALQGGFRRGEFCMISSLAHKWKTGFSMSLFKHFALYNTPYMLDPNKKPLLVRISTEDDIEANFQLLYQSLKYDDTRDFVDIKTHSKAEMSAYIKEKMTQTGYHIKMLRIDPTDWSYQKLLNKIIEYEADGFEVHCCMVDYLSMIPTTGCLQLAGTGSDLRDMYRRIRNFMSTRRILFITPMQLSSQASQLLRGVMNEADFTKMVSGKGYYDTCGRLNQEVDQSIILHSFSKNDIKYLSVTIEKHRHPIVIPDSMKSFFLQFPTNGMPIPDDINREDSSMRSIRTNTSSNTEEDLFKF